MDFIEWCDSVLDALIALAARSTEVRSYGADEYDLARAIFGEDAVNAPEFHSSKARLGMHDALRELEDVDLIDVRQDHFYSPSGIGEEHTADKTPLWEALCNITVKPDQEELLRLVNRESSRSGPHHAWLEPVDREALLRDLMWPEGIDILQPVAWELDGHHLVRGSFSVGPNMKLTARYRGLVWEFRRGFTLESKFIDGLVTDWETTSVEFKRELETRTADQKAELIKDIIAIGNTQASGRRLLIIGFDNSTRAYHGPPNARISQEHIEQLVSQYLEPVVDVRYEAIDYRLGTVGRLEVLRDPKKLPYRVKKSVGDKKRIEGGDVFVRHGSLVEKPTRAELEAIVREGERARAG